MLCSTAETNGKVIISAVHGAHASVETNPARQIAPLEVRHRPQSEVRRRRVLPRGAPSLYIADHDPKSAAGCWASLQKDSVSMTQCPTAERSPESNLNSPAPHQHSTHTWQVFRSGSLLRRRTENNLKSSILRVSSCPEPGRVSASPPWAGWRTPRRVIIVLRPGRLSERHLPSTLHVSTSLEAHCASSCPLLPS